MKIPRERFEEWLANPVTEAVLKTVGQNAEDNKTHWMQVSWDGGDSDPIKLAGMKSRYETALDLSQFAFEDLLDELKLKDENEQRNQS